MIVDKGATPLPADPAPPDDEVLPVVSPLPEFVAAPAPELMLGCAVIVVDAPDMPEFEADT